MIKKIYTFLGSIYFAIALIFTTASLVVIGTFIEASTQSHRSAALLTYSTPLFIALLCAFFLNILLSALRRWPFRARHIPFLITHLGLLMIIAGVMVKTLFGTQGTLVVMEGSGSHDLFIDSTEALRVESKTPEAETTVAYIPIESLENAAIPGLSLQVIEHVSNSQELLVPWIICNKVVVRGLDPLFLYNHSDFSKNTPLPPPNKVQFSPEFPIPIQMWTIRTSDPEALMQKIYARQAKVHVTETATRNFRGVCPLEDLLTSAVPITLSNGENMTIRAEVDLGFSKEKGCTSPHIRVALQSAGDEYLLEIPLDGDKALMNRNLTTPYLGQLPLTLDIVTSPILAIIANESTDTFITFSSDIHGIISTSIDDPKKIDKIYTYDDGFAGYTIQKEITLHPFACGRCEREQAVCDYLEQMIDKACDENAILAPPLTLFNEASKSINEPFGKTLMVFLEEWNRHNTWLYPTGKEVSEPLKPVFSALEEIWDPKERDPAVWATALFSRYEPLLQTGISPIEMLRNEQWPLVDALSEELGPESSSKTHAEDVLTLLTQQIFHATSYLPERKTKGKKNLPTEFSAYLRAYGIHMETITPEIPAKELIAKIKARYGDNTDPIVTLETPIQKRYIPKRPLLKVEDNIPAITVAAINGKVRELIPLTYDKKASGLCWPCGNGEHLLRYQPMVYPIPHHIRLRQARQINYPNSSQAYSYEADLSIKDLRTGNVVEKTVSMNHVHETDDGYRFYLSAMYPSEEGAVKTVQIVANRDPAKYLLTYPGAIIMSIGIVLLFWLRPYKGRDE